MSDLILAFHLRDSELGFSVRIDVEALLCERREEEEATFSATSSSRSALARNSSMKTCRIPSNKGNFDVIARRISACKDIAVNGMNRDVPFGLDGFSGTGWERMGATRV